MDQPTIIKSTQNYAFINVLRGLAALFVAFLHFFINTQSFYGDTQWSQALEPFVLGTFDIGKFGIGLFFLVSGFLIPYSLERSKSIFSFAVHRVFRLYPAYWLSIILFLCLNSWLSYQAKPTTGAIISNLTMLQGYLRQPDLIGAFWTLQIEMTFYILCVFLFFLGLSRKTVQIFYFFLLSTILIALLAHFGKHVPTALFIALSLMFCADALRRQIPNVKQLWLSMAFCLLPICWLAYGKLSIRYILSYWAAMAVFYLVYKFQEFNWFSLPIFTFLADVSYSVYLLHDPIGIQLAKSLASQGYSATISYTVALAITIASSWVVYKLIELPAIRLGRKVALQKNPF